MATNVLFLLLIYGLYLYVLIIITSVWSGVKACHALCFPLKVGRSAMACFRLSRVGYDTEVICVYGMVRNLSYCISFITYYCGM